MYYTDQQLLERVEKVADGFVGWRTGLYLITVRANADVADAFDDKGYVFHCKIAGQRPEFRMVVSCTTNAGTYGLLQFSDYNPMGCAVLKANQIVYDSHQKGLHKGYSAYRQVKGFPYFRDGNRNLRAEERGPVFTDVIAANIHRASASTTSIRIYNWSVACIVMNRPNEFAAFMAYAAGRPISLCVLQEFSRM
jgi:hypothetical protein